MQTTLDVHGARVTVDLYATAGDHWIGYLADGTPVEGVREDYSPAREGWEFVGADGVRYTLVAGRWED